MTELSHFVKQLDSCRSKVLEYEKCEEFENFENKRLPLGGLWLRLGRRRHFGVFIRVLSFLDSISYISYICPKELSFYCV